MFNLRNYKTLMTLLIFAIWVMYGLNWAFISANEFLVASYISIIMNLFVLLLLTLIVVVLNYTLQEEREDKKYRHKKYRQEKYRQKKYRHKRHKTDKRKELEKELRRSGFDPEDLKDHLQD